MRPILFIKKGCPICALAKTAVILFNMKAPLSKKIDIVYEEDHRIKYLYELLGKRVELPVLMDEDLVIQSCQDIESYLKMLEELYLKGGD